jgi:hypothetical protein
VVRRLAPVDDTTTVHHQGDKRKHMEHDVAPESRGSRSTVHTCSTTAMVGGAVKLRKLNLVRHMEVITAEIVLHLIASALWKGLMMPTTVGVRLRWRDRIIAARGVRHRDRIDGFGGQRWGSVSRPALLQADEGNVERLLLLVDVSHLGHEGTHDFFQPIELTDDVAYGWHCVLPRPCACSWRHSGKAW